MIDEHRAELFAEKITQAIRIRCMLIEQNTAALKLIKDQHLNRQVKGLELLNNNLEREKKILLVLKSGSEDGLRLIQEFNAAPEEKYLGKETKDMLYSIAQMFEFFLNKSVPAIEKRLGYEELYLNEKNSIKEKFYLFRLKKTWNEELLLENRLYKIIDQKKLEQNFDFWSSLKNKITTVKMIPEKVKAIPQEELKKQILVSAVNHNIYPIIVANPLAFGFLAFGPDMDSAEKAAIAAFIWSASGFTTRLIHVVLTFKSIYSLAEIMHKSNVINDLSPKNLFEQNNIYN